MSESLLKPEQIGHAAAGKIMVSDGTRFVAADTPTTYALPIIGPTIGISGTSYLGITLPVVVGDHSANVLLQFYWEADDTGVTARWRLRNETTSTTILSGSRASPFSWTLETSSAAAATMPSAGDEVSLEVSYSAVNAGGVIDLRGPVSWSVS